MIVTGATRGLGLAITSRLLRDGYAIVATGRNITKAVEALQEQYPETLSFYSFDMAQVDGIHDLVKSITSAHDDIYGLVNNAAIGIDGVLGTMHNSDIERALRINTLAPMVLTKYVSRSMMLNRQGRVVNISSIIASTGFSGLAAYAASKAAIEGFTRSLARELGRVNITVNAVAPGYMQTDMTLGLEGDKLRSIMRRSPLRRLATPEDVEGAVAYLLGPDGGAVTGTILTVDAGSTC
ncbi:SDR family oxidoreductase [Sphingomonas sp. SRS2]|uniref:SDR family oxidoreductase n=1 Tax=Sphingomonas sp. SRS2 TaxID=133190 RepID=UPI001F2F347A|nr:SDR family oxidoreductase [Sphingomonas sp. SRS2]